MNWPDHISQVVVGFDASDPQQAPWHVGTMLGYMPDPTLLIQREPGGVVSWSERLCRLATTEETIDYWRRRAEAAEEALERKNA